MRREMGAIVPELLNISFGAKLCCSLGGENSCLQIPDYPTAASTFLTKNSSGLSDVTADLEDGKAVLIHGDGRASLYKSQSRRENLEIRA
jgi:hypothetical protein